MPSSSSGARQRSSSTWNRSSAGFPSQASRRARHVCTASYWSGETTHPRAELAAEGRRAKARGLAPARAGPRPEPPRMFRFRPPPNPRPIRGGGDPGPAAKGLDGGRGAMGIETDRAAVDAAGIEVAEDEVGVGDCRLRPAEAVTRRPGLGARASRPDLERARLVGESDDAAAGAARPAGDPRA